MSINPLNMGILNTNYKMAHTPTRRTIKSPIKPTLRVFLSGFFISTFLFKNRF